MAARAIWKAVIRFGEVAVPVKLYSAVEDRDVHFRLLHETDLVPVKQRMVHPGTGDPVPWDEIRRGWETGDGRIVVLEDEELEEVEPEPSRDIEITRFLDPAIVNHQWYDRPYYLGPDGDSDAYFALSEALGEEDVEGIARWVMRKREYQGALRREGEHLMLVTLRNAEEVVSADTLPAPGGRELDPREVDMAEQLVAALSADFEPEAFDDEYRERVMELVESKARGETIELREYRARREPSEEDLTGALEASLRGMKDRRSA